jgi:hypothetical protein
VKALKTTHPLPDDWHTGLNMLQATFNSYHKVRIDTICDVLGWKCVTDEVKGCDCQTSHLVKGVNEGWQHFLLQTYVSDRWHHFK